MARLKKRILHTEQNDDGALRKAYSQLERCERKYKKLWDRNWSHITVRHGKTVAKRKKVSFQSNDISTTKSTTTTYIPASTETSDETYDASTTEETSETTESEESTPKNTTTEAETMESASKTVSTIGSEVMSLPDETYSIHEIISEHDRESQGVESEESKEKEQVSEQSKEELGAEEEEAEPEEENEAEHSIGEEKAEIVEKSEVKEQVAGEQPEEEAEEEEEVEDGKEEKREEIEGSEKQHKLEEKERVLEEFKQEIEGSKEYKEEQRAVPEVKSEMKTTEIVNIISTMPSKPKILVKKRKVPKKMSVPIPNSYEIFLRKLEESESDRLATQQFQRDAEGLHIKYCNTPTDSKGNKIFPDDEWIRSVIDAAVGTHKFLFDERRVHPEQNIPINIRELYPVPPELHHKASKAQIQLTMRERFPSQYLDIKSQKKYQMAWYLDCTKWFQKQGKDEFQD